MSILSQLLVVFGVMSVAAVEGSGVGGWYTSQNTTATDLSCLTKTNDAQYIIYSAYYQTKISTNVCENLKAASKAGIAHRDVVFTPCPTCSSTSPEDQLATMVNYLDTNCEASTWTKRIWLDADNSQIWYTPWNEIGYKQNQDFFNKMVDACTSTAGVVCGVKSSATQWGYIQGSKTYSYAPATKLDLWYSSTNGVASFADFVAFGGFTAPYSKSYVQSFTTCSPTPETGNYLTWEDWAPVYN